jgi:cytochrome c-type biogenesis protein CcmF
MSFLFVLYSTFLTRTGVLGDTSVHSFTGEGATLYWHLIIMMLVFIALPLGLYIKNRKDIPVEHREEQMNSREFWMFVGSLLLLVSATYIIILTSLPFINKLFGTSWAIGQEVEYVYNRIMVMVAFILAMLTATVQYFKYKDTDKKYIWSKIWKPSLISLIIAILISVFGHIQYDKFGIGFLVAIHMAVWAAVYAAVANFNYLASVIRWKMKAAGSSVTHIGFAMMLFGILISSANKELVSENRTGIAIEGIKDVKGRNEDPLENVTLIHNVPTPMRQYTVTYEGDSTETKNNKVYFKIHFVKEDTVQHKVLEDFYVTPNAFLMKSEQGTQLSSNPGSRHYLTNDVFVYITSWLNPENVSDTSKFEFTPVNAGDTVYYSNGLMVVDKLVSTNKHDNPDLPIVDSVWLADVTLISKEGRKGHLSPSFFKTGNELSYKTDTLMQQNLVVGLNRSNNGKIELAVKESNAVMRYITMKAYRFPWINLLWLGTIIMVFGFLLSMWHRAKSRLYVV